MRVVYAIATEIPVLALYGSPHWSAGYLLVCFSVSVWNGAGFYIEVFGRKCVAFLPSPSFPFPFPLTSPHLA
jgi:hypothetical protein